MSTGAGEIMTVGQGGTPVRECATGLSSVGSGDSAAADFSSVDRGLVLPTFPPSRGSLNSRFQHGNSWVSRCTAQTRHSCPPRPIWGRPRRKFFSNNESKHRGLLQSTLYTLNHFTLKTALGEKYFPDKEN